VELCTFKSTSVKILPVERRFFQRTFSKIIIRYKPRCIIPIETYQYPSYQ
jgi:hypothetical protein